MKVIVIGCGPAGLAAAHAAVGLKCNVVVMAPREKRLQRGPLLIQRAIPGINTDHPDGYIQQIVRGGSILDYRYKLYGDVNININGNILEPGYHAWRMNETYDKLWGLYSYLIVDSKVEPEEVDKLLSESDLVVNTAPAPAFCLTPERHHFRSAIVAVTDTAQPDTPPNTLVFNADFEVPWVRSSRIFENEVTEWGPENVPYQARSIRKPISTNCDCHPHVLRTGRFGSWRNETWVDTAYWDVRNAIVTM